MERLTRYVNFPDGKSVAQTKPTVLTQSAIERLAAYEDTGQEPYQVWALAKLEKQQTTLTEAEKDNTPLTAEELWSMDGLPVWCVDGDGNEEWCLINIVSNSGYRYKAPDAIDSTGYTWDGYMYAGKGATKESLCGRGWLAYRRKPSEA